MLMVNTVNQNQYALVRPWWREPGAPGLITDHLPSELSEPGEKKQKFMV
jgi:hypothetical protein